MRCVIFAAVSTPAQMGDDKESIPTQIADARQLIESRDAWHEVHEPLIVEGQSRAIDWLDQATTEVPALAELLALADAGKIDLVLIRDFDRLARSQLLLDQIRFRLRQNRVQLYSLNQPVEPLPPEEADQQSDSAFLLESFGGILAEWENRIRVRRAQMGIRGRVKRGLPPTNRVPYGYTVENGSVIVIPERAEVVRRIFDRLLSGWGSTSISRELNRLGHRTSTGKPWSGFAVRYVECNPFYAGFVSLGRHRTKKTPSGRIYRYRVPQDEWLIAEGCHEPIISRETWRAAQREYKRRTTFRSRRQTRTYPLSGLLRCDYCGGSMRIVYSTPQLAYYGCSRHHSHGTCQRNAVRVSEIESKVNAWFKELMADPETIERLLAETDKARQENLEQRKEELEKEVRKYGRALYHWTRDYEDGLLQRHQFYEHRADTNERLDNVQADLKVVTQGLEGELEKMELRRSLRAMLENAAGGVFRDRNEQRQLYHALFSEISVRDGEMTGWERA